MAYNQMLQSTIEGVKSIARTDLCLMDTEGNVIAATNEEAQQYKESVLTFVDSPAEIQVVQGYQYFKIDPVVPELRPVASAIHELHFP